LTFHFVCFTIIFKMKNLLLLFVLVAAMAFVFAEEEEGQEKRHHHHHHHQHHHHHHHHKDQKCRGEPVVHNNELENSFKECKKEVRKHEDDSEGDKHGRSCFAVCALTKVGALDDKGLPDESKLKDMINAAIVNQDAREELKEEIMQCGRNATGLGTDLSDNTCSNYNPYLHCLWLSAVEVCADPFPKEDEDLE